MFKSSFRRIRQPFVQPLVVLNEYHHIQISAQQGCLAWQKVTGYNLRNYAELVMQRYKRIVGNTMKARGLPQQKTEA
jgi:hypothetical protein